MNDTWVATYKVTLRNMCDDNEPDAEDIVKAVLKDDGLFGCADLDDMELINLERVVE